MTKRILIAEDEPRFKVQYKSWAESAGYQVLEASSLNEGLERLTEVDAVITDYGLIKGDGNDLAKIAKQHNLPVAGITGGLPTAFDTKYVDIPETKTISERNFKTLLECLFSENPREDYRRKTQEQVSYELPAAASILLQGYYVIKAFQENREEIVSDGKVLYSKEAMASLRQTNPDLAKQDPSELFEMFRDGNFIPEKIYSIACEINPSLESDQRIKTIFQRLHQRDYDLSVEDAVYASKRILEGSQ